MLKKFTLMQFLFPSSVFLLLQGFACAQTLTNLELLYHLTDSLSKQIICEIPEAEDSLVLTLSLGESYSVFANNIKSSFIKSGKKILDKAPGELIVPHVDIVIEYAGIEYGEMFRDGWFGPHFVQRHAMLSGNYIQIFSGGEIRNFTLETTDTVNVDGIKFLENESFSFTSGSLPSEPFISGWAEPVIAIGTAAVIIAIFFSVRSK